MATQTIEFSAASGQTITARLFAAGSDTVEATASSVTERSNATGVYAATVTSTLAGVYRLVATNAAGTLLAQWWVRLANANGDYIAYETPNADYLDAAISSRLATGDYTAPLDTAGTAAAVWDALLATYTTANSFGARLVRSTNSNSELQLTGSHHAAAVLHDAEPDSIPADALAAATITAIQAGLATSGALTTAQSDLDNIQTRLPSALVGGRMDSDVGAMHPGVIAAIQSGLSTLTAAQVNAEVLDVMAVDLFSELNAVPGASSSLKDKITFLFMLARNKMTQDLTNFRLFADDTSTQVAVATVSDNGTLFQRGELA